MKTADSTDIMTLGNITAAEREYVGTYRCKAKDENNGYMGKHDWIDAVYNVKEGEKKLQLRMGKKLATTSDYERRTSGHPCTEHCAPFLLCKVKSLTGRSKTSLLMEKQAAHLTMLPVDVLRLQSIVML